MPVLEAILQTLVPKARAQGEILAFSVPAATEGQGGRAHVPRGHAAPATSSRWATRPVAINEGLAVIFSELEDNNFTGIGISCGGGMCNVTLAYLSIPSHHVQHPQGRRLHRPVGGRRSSNEHATRVKVIKEEGLDLSRAAQGQVREGAAHLLRGPRGVAGGGAEARRSRRRRSCPRTDRPLPIVLSGGTAKPRASRTCSRRRSSARSLPVEISGVRMASDPLTATARGALIAALYEK